MINTKIMNDCLLDKWIWKIHKGADELWFQLIKAKYLQSGSFFTSCAGTSQFWQGLHKIKHLFKWGAIYQVKDGKSISFWEDIWLRDVPVKTIYPDLYSMCSQPQAKVIDYWDGTEWNIAFRRSLSVPEKHNLDDLTLLENGPWEPAEKSQRHTTRKRALGTG